MRLEAFFLPVDGGQRFCLLHRPAPVRSRGAILFVHSFAEEMNRCRRAVARQARAFADDGWAVLQIDLLGCGDSSGDHGDATWERWVEDVVAAATWLREQVDERLFFWGVRAGALLASEAASRTGALGGLVLWQPVLSGKQFLQQFLRLKTAGEMLSQTKSERNATSLLRDRLGAGETVEIAGYSISSGLGLGLESAELRPVHPPTRVAWLEVAGAATADLRPASRTRIASWQAAGHPVEAQVVQGPLFWQTLNTTEAPALVEATRCAVQSW